MHSSRYFAAATGWRLIMSSLLSSLLNSRASTLQRGVVAVLAVFIAMIAIMISPLASVALSPNQAFIPALLTALLMAKGLTAYLLFLHYFSVRRISVGLLASVYLYIACFSALRLYYVNDPSLDLRWFWMLWHGVSEPGILVAMLCQARWGEQKLSSGSMYSSVWPLTLAPVALAYLLLAWSRSGLLPPDGQIGGWHLLNANLAEIGVWTGNVLALLSIVLITRLRNVLHLWLAFVVYVTLINSSLTLFTSSIPYSLGWYAANVSSMISAMALVYILLRELNHIYGSIQFANTVLWVKSMHDSLTGLYNRRYLDEQLTLEIQRAQRSGSPIAVILLDVDYFKRINDARGHQAGDKCLANIAGILKSVVRRPADFVARYGGEEFAMVLPETSAEGALARAEAARISVAQTAMEAGTG